LPPPLCETISKIEQLTNEEFSELMSSSASSESVSSFLAWLGVMTPFAIPATVCYFLAAHHGSFADS
jgi:hypothetical protein